MLGARGSAGWSRGRALDTGTPVCALFAAHGGCGVTTVAALLGSAVEMGPDDPLMPDWVPAVVCRSTTHGAASACELVSCWPDRAPRPWLVVVADAPLRPPRSARFYLRAMRDRVAGVAHVPYLHQIRAAVSVREVLNDPAVSRAGHHLRLALSAPAPSVSARPVSAPPVGAVSASVAPVIVPPSAAGSAPVPSTAPPSSAPAPSAPAWTPPSSAEPSRVITPSRREVS